ncbi:MAG TPA: DNA replication/repair protein RecF [Candidatus Dormibacteraeota bacterium]
MRLLSLRLRNYRNYARLDLEPGPQLNVFLGANGQGKTNLLESIAILALSSSPRARRDAELIGPVAAEASIEGVAERAGRRLELQVDYRADGARTRRRIQIGGAARRSVDLPGSLRIALFWPDDLNLVKAGPEYRRRLLNQLLVQVEPGYARTLSSYARVVEQRNALLKQIAQGEAPASGLDVWDQELVELGTHLATARAAAVEQLAERAAAHHAAIAGGERLEVGYQGPPQPLVAAVAESRGLDIRRGTTTCGPHRDDLAIHLDGREARGYASQGQQRTAVVSLKLAEADVIEARTGEAPVLLLDDVLSELDPPRRAALVERLGGGGQVVVTSAETGPLPAAVMAAAEVHCIEQGRLIACG